MSLKAQHTHHTASPVAAALSTLILSSAALVASAPASADWTGPWPLPTVSKTWNY